jgi:hypothetical protein
MVHRKMYRLNLSRLICFIIFCSFTLTLRAQDFKDYSVLHFTSTHTAFPDTGRVNGHLYDSVFYSATEHYSDSSVLLIIPKPLESNKTVDLVFWFHGWRNNIDTAAEFYKLTRQFLASGRNAVLVLAETAKNSPDSYGGKLEEPGMFRLLTDDVLHALKKGGYISEPVKAGNIVLAGHSGAFRVIAYILQNGQVPVQEVFLFDALYAEVDKYQSWLNQDWSHHFVHWFTNHGGGTDEVSNYMMTQLKNHSDHFLLTEELGLQQKTIKDNYILFVHSFREHNVIINDPDDFQLLLENSFVLRPIK